MHFNAAKCNIMRMSQTRNPTLFNYPLTGQVLEEDMDAKYLGGGGLVSYSSCINKVVIKNKSGCLLHITNYRFNYFFLLII